MRKIFSIIFTALLVIILFSGCRRATHNGWIDGNWRIKSVEQIADGVFYDKDTVIYPESSFIAIQLELAQIRTGSEPGVKGRGATAVMLHDRKNDKITLEYRLNDKDVNPKWMIERGFCSNPETYDVHANSKRLTLRSANVVINCERW